MMEFLEFVYFLSCSLLFGKNSFCMSWQAQQLPDVQGQALGINFSCASVYSAVTLSQATTLTCLAVSTFSPFFALSALVDFTFLRLNAHHTPESVSSMRRCRQAQESGPFHCAILADEETNKRCGSMLMKVQATEKLLVAFLVLRFHSRSACRVGLYCGVLYQVSSLKRFGFL